MNELMNEHVLFILSYWPEGVGHTSISIFVVKSTTGVFISSIGMIRMVSDEQSGT